MVQLQRLTVVHQRLQATQRGIRSSENAVWNDKEATEHEACIENSHDCGHADEHILMYNQDQHPNTVSFAET